jgi:hypothetical protein
MAKQAKEQQHLSPNCVVVTRAGENPLETGVRAQKEAAEAERERVLAGESVSAASERGLSLSARLPVVPTTPRRRTEPCP